MTLAQMQAFPKADLPRIFAYDNTVPAGQFENGILTIHLELREGDWYPEQEGGFHLAVYTFGEEGKPPMIPGPLIRVPEGTEIRATIRNLLSHAAVVHGFHQRPGDSQIFLTLAPDEVREVRFKTGPAGTYYYWATTEPQNRLRVGPDTQLSGAFVVDPPGAAAEDRIFVLGLWWSTFKPPEIFDEVLTINGKSWPYTERLTYRAGDTIHWRVINTSVVPHPMHLHGAYYRVDSTGDGEHDLSYSPAEQRRVVTELVPAGGTMTVSWSPEHPGNWLFHCHLLNHMVPETPYTRQLGYQGSAYAEHDSAAGMAGLVVGIHVLPAAGERPAAKHGRASHLTLYIRERPGQGNASNPGVAIALKDGRRITESAKAIGPPIVLIRGQPAEITVVNQLREPTGIHWHGIELESYYDGVPNWSGDARQVMPPVPPGGTFTARMTPPRAGTFIYHTHWHDISQLTGGLYGPLLVLEPGEKFNPDTDKVFLVGRGGPNFYTGPLLINGSSPPSPAEMRVGTRYRLRLINITPDDDKLEIKLLAGTATLTWRAFSKDGSELPPGQRTVRESHQIVSVGETYDFEFEPKQEGELELEATYLKFKAAVPMRVHR